MSARQIRGLTLWQPMAWAIAAGHKTTENRPYRPWQGVTHLAIHAGLRWHDEHAQQIREYLGISVPDRRDPAIVHGAVIAVARLGKILTENDAESMADHWFSGPFGWCLEDVHALEAVPCKGAQGLWYLSHDVLTAIDAQLETR